MTEPPDTDLLTFFWRVLENNSPITLISLVLAIATWLGGGNLLVARHYRRLGKSPWSGFRSGAFPFTEFNAREWRILGLLALASLTLFLLAVLANGPVHR